MEMECYTNCSSLNLTTCSLLATQHPHVAAGNKEFDSDIFRKPLLRPSFTMSPIILIEAGIIKEY